MTFRAVYRDGEVVLPADARIPDGARLDVRVVPAIPAKKVGGRAGRAGRGKTKAAKPVASLSKRLRTVIGKTKGLPSDASRNLDHYLYGARKR